MKDKNYVRLGQIYQFLQKKVNFMVDRVSEFECLICNDFDVNYQLPKDSLVCQNNPQYSGNTVLHFFAERYKDFGYCNFYDKYFDLLIANGANVTIKNTNGLTPLLLAFIETKNKSRSLDDFNGQNTNNIRLQNGISHFHVLCTTNNVDLVELFLKSGVDVNERVDDDHPNYPGYTPLHFAAHYSCLKIIELLVNYGADLNVSDARGMSSMHLIAKCGKDASYNKISKEKTEFLKKILLDSNTSNLPDNLGFSRIHYSCVLIDNEDSIDKYYDESVDVDCFIELNSPIWPGCTPLHLAAKSYHSKTVEFLLEKGANILAKDANGITALDIILDKFHRIDNRIQILYSEKRHQFSKLKLTDGTNLLQVIKAMAKPKQIKQFLKKNIKDMNTFIPLNSPLWPGYNLLHLNALFNDDKYGFVERGIDFSMINANGMSPFHLAFRERSYLVIREIYKYIPKKPVNLIDHDNVSHLHVLCAESHQEEQKYALKAVESILKNGADPNISTINDLTFNCGYKITIIKSGTTPLHIAVYEKNVPLAIMLMSHGAKPSIADSVGVTPFQLALIKLTEKPKERYMFEKPDPRPMKKLVEHMLESHGKDLMAGEIGVNILRRALILLSNKYTELIKQMITEFDREKRYEELGLTRLQVACVIGDYDLFIKELNSGADVNAQIAFDSSLWPGDTALHILFKKPRQSKNDFFVESLLKHGADITLKNAEKLTPLHLNQDYLLQNDSFLFKYNFTSVNPANSEGLSHFHLCCMKNNTLVIDEFLKSGVDVNIGVDYFAKKYAGYTPLHFLVENMQNANTEVIKLLLNYGADPNIQNADGLNACHIALLRSSSSREAILRCPKVDVYAPAIFSNTALEILLQEYNSLGEKIVKKKVMNMLQLGYELCHKDKNGKTVLHKSTKPYVVKMLLSQGADINIRDDNGKTCIQYVSADNKKLRKVFDEHIQLLQAAGLYVDDLNIVGRNNSISNSSVELERAILDEKLKEFVDPSFSSDYFFSEKFVVDYKTIPVFLRQKIYDFCYHYILGFECLSPLMLLQLWKARARTRLLKPAESVLQALIGNIGVLIPDCLEPILNYLKNDDLMNLVRLENEKLEFLSLP